MFYLVIIKSDSQAITKFDDEEKARSAFHSELASDYLYFEDGTINSFTIALMNQSGDVICKEFKFRQSDQI